jgi:hypothetical protein
MEHIYSIAVGYIKKPTFWEKVKNAFSLYRRSPMWAVHNIITHRIDVKAYKPSTKEVIIKYDKEFYQLQCLSGTKDLTLPHLGSIHIGKMIIDGGDFSNFDELFSKYMVEGKFYKNWYIYKYLVERNIT